MNENFVEGKKREKMPTPLSLQQALHALNFPNYAGIDVDNEEHYRTIVAWLEDQKIRLWQTTERAGLRNKSSEKWSAEYRKVHYCFHEKHILMSPLQYLDELDCPYKDREDEHLLQLDWLLKHALALQYAENCTSSLATFSSFIITSAADELHQHRAGASTQNGAASPLDKLDGALLPFSDCKSHSHYFFSE